MEEINEEELFQKKYKGCRNFFRVIIVIAIIGLFVGLATSEEQDLALKWIIILAPIFFGLIISFLVLTKRKKVAGPIIGICIGVLWIIAMIYSMIVNLEISIGSIAFIFINCIFISECRWFIQYFKKIK